MASSKKIIGVVLGVTALALTTFGVVVSAIDDNPAQLNDHNLALHGQAPRTAKVTITINTGQRNNVTGDVNVNFRRDELAASLAIPGVFSVTHINVVMKNDQIYIGVPSLASLLDTPWVSIPNQNPDLFPIALEMSSIKLDMGFFERLGKVTVIHNGPYTTYRITRTNLAVKLPKGSPLSLSTSVNVLLTITVASEGQLASATLHVGMRQSHIDVAMRVLAYNVPVRIVAPPASQVQPVTKSLLDKFFGSNSPSSTSTIQQLLSPGGIAALGQIRVN